ncbi:MAG: acyltransferase family protein, partial [Limisphaerales bacterium]
MNAAAENPSRIPELDGIRGIAILLVVLAHYFVLPVGPGFAAANFLGTFFGLAWSGVDLFFVLSGFLIGGILLDAKASNNFFKVFYTRRVCRIFPLYFLW